MKRASKIALIGSVGLVAAVGVLIAVQLNRPELPVTSSSPTPPPAPTSTGAPDSEGTTPDHCSSWSAVRFAPTRAGNTTTQAWLEGPELADTGSRAFASGMVETDADGSVVSYTVEPGDAGLAIGERFCVDYVTLLQFNHVWPEIHPGDVLELVVDESQPFPIDPVRTD